MKSLHIRLCNLKYNWSGSLFHKKHLLEGGQFLGLLSVKHFQIVSFIFISTWNSILNFSAFKHLKHLKEFCSQNYIIFSLYTEGKVRIDMEIQTAIIKKENRGKKEGKSINDVTEYYLHC